MHVVPFFMVVRRESRSLVLFPDDVGLRIFCLLFGGPSGSPPSSFLSGAMCSGRRSMERYVSRIMFAGMGKTGNARSTLSQCAAAPLMRLPAMWRGGLQSAPQLT